MSNILINAYACSPNWGSEQGMAWNWIVNLSQYCNLYVITEGEFKGLIEEATDKLPHKDNLHFYYNSIPDKVRKMCWNQGDWLFYYHYRKWQKSTYRMALQIIGEHKIDIIHQLNMIGFREPGYLWKIKNMPYIWGPIGGMELIPTGYLQGASVKQKLFTYLKNILNSFQTHYSPRVRKAITRADVLIAAVIGVKDKIEQYYGKEVILINETGCYPNPSVIEDKRGKENFDILWVGKFDFRKQLGLALQTIAKVKHLKGLYFHIVGTGSDAEVIHYKLLAEQLGISAFCHWHGLIPNKEVQELMRKADLFFFTSIMEGTPHVVLEAIGNHLPVLCLNTCGQAASVNKSVGIKIQISNLIQSTDDFAKEICRLYTNRELLYSMSYACDQRQKELSWDSKAKQVVNIYNKFTYKK
jgi:glycosyltransferase involved in cell wall biosynthesis